MRRVPLVDLSSQYSDLDPGVFANIVELIRDCKCIQGDVLRQFEEEFAAYIGVRFAVGVGCGLDALTIALMCLQIGPGDEVIVPVNTFVATALAVSRVGATPVFIDCDATYNMDLAQLLKKVTPRTRAVIPVHLTGQPVDVGALRATLGSRRHEVYVVEDAAQAHGASINGAMCGSMGEIGCFSFYPAKNLGCCGDGGMMVTNIKALADEARIIRNYGEDRKYHHVAKGVNSCLDPVQAMILSAKLPHLTAWNDHRRSLAALYQEQLRGVGDIEFANDRGGHAVYHLMPIFTQKRDFLQDHLRERGIETRVHYPTPIHRQPAYAENSHESYPVAEKMCATELSLPMSAHTPREHVEYVCECIKEFFK